MSEKSVAQKLQIKPGCRVLFVQPPANLLELLGEMPEAVEVISDGGTADVLVAFVSNRNGLERFLPELKKRMSKKVVLWVAYHKGTSKVKTDIHRDSINAYASKLGLVGVAIIAIDQDWAALRLKLTE